MYFVDYSIDHLIFEDLFPSTTDTVLRSEEKAMAQG